MMKLYVYEVEPSIFKPDRMPDWARRESLQNCEPALKVRWK